MFMNKVLHNILYLVHSHGQCQVNDSDHDFEFFHKEFVYLYDQKSTK